MFTQQDVVRVLGAFDDAGIWFVLEGGWGVDALVGKQTRPHGDLDVTILESDLARTLGVLNGFGYSEVPDEWPGLPLRTLWRDPEAREVDVHPIVMDAAGNGWQHFGSPKSWTYYSADGLRGAGCIAGRGVRCLTPELQLRHHLGFDWRDVDVHDMRLLQAHFGLWIPPPHDPRTVPTT